MTSVLLVDDQGLVRTGFRMMLDATADLTVVGEAADGAHAVASAVRLQPDVVLMDVRMPGMDGIAATTEIVRRTACAVLVLTTFDLDEYAFAALRAGASGFLLKDVQPDALYEAIRAVATGDAVLTPRITRDLVDRFADTDAVTAAASVDDDYLRDLTAREQEVFGLIADGSSNAEIATALFVTEATVKTHITRLLAKLGLRDRVQVVIAAYEHGIRIAGR
jgi:DNA-binding NarL/FixJ family response regulator